MKLQEIVTQLGLWLVLAGMSALSPSSPAYAWGATGHEFISGIAAELFPEEIPEFLRTPEAVATLPSSAASPTATSTPARRTTATSIPCTTSSSPTTATWPASCRSTSCRSRSTNTTRSSSRGSSSQYKSGYLPYAIVVGWHQLAKDFAYWRASSIGAKTAVEPADRAWFEKDRKRRELLLLRDLGYWSHFPGDASMPLHTSEHFYGWGPYPNPNGYATGDAMELFVKGTFVRDNIKRDVVKAGSSL